MSVNKPSIRDKKDIYKEVSAKDLSRKELLSYIFGDFLRAFYIVGCIFFDGLIIGEAYDYVPGFFSANTIIEHYFPTAVILTIPFILCFLRGEAYKIAQSLKRRKSLFFFLGVRWNSAVSAFN